VNPLVLVPFFLSGAAGLYTEAEWRRIRADGRAPG